MDLAEVQALFRNFAAPLADYTAISAQRKDGAEFMARTLWTALIAAPEAEEGIWEILKTTGKLDDDSHQAINELVLSADAAGGDELFHPQWHKPGSVGSNGLLLQER